MKLLVRVLTVTLLTIVGSVPMRAQTITATVEGTVTDSTGGRLEGVSVAIQSDTLTRTILSNASGVYRVAGLPPGRYSIVATRAPFQDRRFEEIDLLLNRTVTLDIQLELSRQTETVEVSAPARSNDVTSSAVSHVVTSAQIDSIPLNGRNYLDLVLLTPGVVNSNARSELSDRDTRGAIFGERGGNTAFLIDGFENNDDFRGGVFQAYTQDAIQEFEVIASGYTAEFGRGSGGVVNAITKSGTNETRGSVSAFLRNDALDASSIDGGAAPDLARYDASAAIGGPVARDRAWYFGSFEHVFERREALFPAVIPDVLRASEDFSKHPEATDDRLFGKYSRSLAPGHDLRAEGSWTRLSNLNRLASSIALPSASNDTDTKTALAAVEYRSVSHSRLMFETSASYREQRFGQNPDLGAGFSRTITFTDETHSFDIGPRFGSMQTLDQRYATARASASVFGSRHTAKVGAEYIGTAIDGTTGQGLVTQIVTTVANFARYGVDSFQIPQGVGFLQPGDNQSRMRNQGASLFAQDNWRPVPSLTLNLGVRYDYDSAFGDKNNLAPRLGAAWALDDKTVLRANWGLFYDRYRFGLAQAVPEFGGFNGRTVVEMDYPRLLADAPQVAILGGVASAAGSPFVLHDQFGIPHDAVVTRDNIQSLTGLAPEEFLARANAFLARFGSYPPVDFSPSTGYLRQDLGATYQDAVRIARPFKTPYNSTVTAGLERTLPGNVVAEATYIHRAIRNILGIRIPNLSPQSRVRRRTITTDGGPLQRTYGPWYEGNYDAVVLSVDRAFNGRYQAQASYTYASGTDNLLNPNLATGVGMQGGGSVPTDNLDLEADRGNSDLVVPHTVVVSGLLALPWQVSVSGLFRGTSGTFFSATSDRPVDVDYDGVRSSRAIGTVRNQFTGPKSLNLDMRIEKRFTLGRASVSGLVEFFNLLNASNPQLVDTVYTAGAPGVAFGSTRIPLPGREAQLGLRLRF